MAYDVMADLLPTIATQEDREYAWRHAFAYADQAVSMDDACEYADYYLTRIVDEEDMNHWPSHSDLFLSWRIVNDK